MAESTQPTRRKSNWWLIAGGVVLVACGLFVFASPSFFLEFLTVWAGFGFLASGAMGLASYFSVRKQLDNAGWHLFMAVLDLAVGLVLMLYPFTFAHLVPWMLGVSFIVFGLIVVTGLMPFSHLVPETRTMAIISGVLAVIVGIMFIVWPASISLWVAAFALVRGITLVAVGMTFR